MNVISETKHFLQHYFQLNDLGDIKYFIGFEIHRTKQSIIITKHNYVIQLLNENQFVDCKPANTPMNYREQLSKIGDHELKDPSCY